MTSDSDSNSPDDDDRTIPPRTSSANDPTILPGVSPVPSSAVVPQVDGFQLLQELGRGGMGVVYKAINKRLDRTVALKMILTGQFASEEQVKRFQIEAETAARLDHPGIVPIYEFGQSRGVHFFSMKLIDGKSLAEQLDEYQSDPRKSAKLMIQIARAVHHAHERGVLHRDLKPANILIDQSGAPAITDLGLAKQLGEESGLTQTGLVMGSPGFMSPEQAAGKSDVTTGVDVYALGAVLYWLITGRPPFQGDTNLEVILQTMDKEPESIRVFRPEADRDLNLICQKSLQKSPDQRYPSAAAFADDLQAWLDGDRLSVKPPSAVNLARIWIRKNVRAISIAIGLGAVCGFLVGMIILMLMVDNQLSFTKYANSLLGESTEPWMIKYFSWVESVPHGLLRNLPVCITWLTVGFGIGTIGLVKPKSREISMVSAISASLVAGIVAFVLSLGWAPIIDHSVSKARNDIELISDSFWMNDAAERELAKQALIQRYPGTTDVPVQQRGTLLYRKIMNDQAQGIPRGMWIGIGTTLFLTVLPYLFAATFAGLIWQNGHRGGAFIGKSIELGIYSSLIFLVLTKSVSDAIGLSPGLGIQVFTLGGLGLALYLGLKEAGLPWRLFGFALASVVIFWNFAESSHIRNAAGRARTAQTTEEYRSAAHYFEKKIARTRNQDDRFQLAILYAYLGEDEKYRRQCNELLANFENMYRPSVAERIAKACLLRPGLVGDQATVHKFARLASGFDSRPNQEFLCFCRALSELRQGNASETFHWNQRCRDAIDPEFKTARVFLEASTQVVDALAHISIGQEDAAKEAINSSRSILESGKPEGGWQDRLIYEILLNEATRSDLDNGQ